MKKVLEKEYLRRKDITIDKSRLIQLDIFRFLAIFLVLGRHSKISPIENGIVLFKLTESWFWGGWIGVDLFFVLSGFLVSGLLFNEYKKSQSIQIKRFLIRRGFKIYPPFWVMLIVTVIFNLIFSEPIPLKDFFGELLFLQNYIGRLWNHTWSLAVEEHFYIGLAILTYFLLKIRKKKNSFEYIPHIFIGVAFVCFILRLLMAIYKGVNTFPTHFRIDSLFFGVLISYYWHFKNLSENNLLEKYKYILGFVGLILLLPFFFFDSASNPHVFVYGFTIIYIASGMLLLSFLKIEIKKNWLAIFLGKIGFYSYSIYLWHMFIIKTLNNYITKFFVIENWIVWETCAFAGSIGFGIIMAKIVEYPFLHIRDKYFPSKLKAKGN